MRKNTSITLFWLLGFSMLCGFKASSESVAVIVNKSSPIATLTEFELARIYQGRNIHWNDRSKIVVINRPVNSEIRRQFYNYALQSSPARKFYNTSTPIPFKTMVVVSDLSTKRFVAYIPNSIGYISAKNIDDSVKVLMILEELDVRN